MGKPKVPECEGHSVMEAERLELYATAIRGGLFF